MEAKLVSSNASLEERIFGCILGTALGDAIGIPYEGLSRQRAARLLGEPDRHRFFFGRGMVSDDTEHTCFVAQSLILSRDDVKLFQQSLARTLKLWLLSLPAGVGLATARAILKLLVGIRPDRSGVFSAGNGPAMRAPILGVAISDVKVLREFVRASTRITHTDPKAELGAFAVALAAHVVTHDPNNAAPNKYLQQLSSLVGDDGNELCELISRAVDSVNAGNSTEQFAISLGLTSRVSGYVMHTVPVALHAWFANPCDYHHAVRSVIRCGGDADSTAAIVGGIVGAGVGRNGLPKDWCDNLAEWPRTISWMEQLAKQLADAMQSPMKDIRPVRVSMCAVLLRNLFFLLVVLFHGFRRLAPPY